MVSSHATLPTRRIFLHRRSRSTGSLARRRSPSPVGRTRQQCRYQCRRRPSRELWTQYQSADARIHPDVRAYLDATMVCRGSARRTAPRPPLAVRPTAPRHFQQPQATRLGRAVPPNAVAHVSFAEWPSAVTQRGTASVPPYDITPPPAHSATEYATPATASQSPASAHPPSNPGRAAFSGTR